MPGIIENMKAGRNEREKRGGYGWDGDGGDIARRRESDRHRMWWLMGCQLMVHMELFLRAELPRLAEHRPSVSLSARLCFRNSLCSSLESLYFLPPGERQALNGHTNEATFLLCIMVFPRNCGRRKTKMKLITAASSLPLLSSLFHPSSSQLLQTF